MPSPLLLYRPFLDPLPLWAHEWWLVFIVPLALLISAAYKAVRLPEDELRLPVYARKVGLMTFQVLAVMFGLALGMYLFVEYVVPLYG